VYTDPHVSRFIADNFVPVRVHAQQQRDEFQKLGEQYNAQWTPTILILDASGQERHRIEGFIAADEFIAQLAVGAAHAAFAARDFSNAERRFREIVERHPQSETAAEAQYWAGVSRYKATGDAAALQDTARAFSERYTDSTWATKASVWKAA
jgi:TolA-binding protein